MNMFATESDMFNMFLLQSIKHEDFLAMPRVVARLHLNLPSTSLKHMV